MLSVLIIADNRVDRLARTLTSLVPHAISGAVADVAAVFEAEPATELKALCDEAGCAIIDRGPRPLDELVGQGRAPWLLVIDAGARPVGDWLDAVESYVNAPAGAAGARFRLALRDNAPWWRRVLGQPGGPSSPFRRGLLISRRQAQAQCKPGKTLSDLPRGLSIRTLPAMLQSV